jgi:hypothetical protein
MAAVATHRVRDHCLAPGHVFGLADLLVLCS